MLGFDYLDTFWQHLREGGASDVFLTATLKPPEPDGRPSRSGAFYAALTAFVPASNADESEAAKRSPAHLAQFFEPLVGVSDLDDFADPTGTQKRIDAQLQSYRDTAAKLSLTVHRGRWKAL